MNSARLTAAWTRFAQARWTRLSLRLVGCAVVLALMCYLSVQHIPSIGLRYLVYRLKGIFEMPSRPLLDQNDLRLIDEEQNILQELQYNYGPGALDLLFSAYWDLGVSERRIVGSAIVRIMADGPGLYGWDVRASSRDDATDAKIAEWQAWCTKFKSGLESLRK